MTPRLLLIFLSCLVINEVSAQKRELFKINPGEKVADKIPVNEMYRYPQFVPGKVYHINNTYSIAPLNYNALFGEMQFIDKNGDTLSLSDEKKIRLIIADEDTFYYSDGYLELIYDDGNIKLGRKTLISFANRQKLGGFGESSQGSIETYGVLSNQSYLKELVANQVITMAKETVFYVMDAYNAFKEVSRKSLQDIFPKNEKDLKNYMKESKVDLKNEEDLFKLILHLKALVPIRPI